MGKKAQRSKLRLILATAVAVVLSASLIASAALSQADDLNQKKNAVQTKIDANKQDITQAEAALAKAQQAVSDTKKQLTAAQSDLAAKQQVTQQAQAEDNRLAASLASAQTELSNRQDDLKAAQAAVTQGEQDLAAQRDDIGLIAQQTAQQNTTLLSLSILFTDFDTSDINNRLQWASNSFNASQDAMNQLLAAQAKLEAAQAKAQTAQDAAASAEAAVQQKKDAAAAHLGVTKQAQAAAQVAANNVNTQLAAHQQAQDDAQKALDDAIAEQKQLAADMAKIQAQIAAELAAAQKKAKDDGTSNSPGQLAPSTGTFFYRPVPGRVTSPYGWRINPITHRPEMHPGVDFGAACGTPIHAAASGTVTYAGWNGGYGNYTLINHGKIAGKYYSTGYGHQSKIIVHRGQHVTRGQVIGYVGTTGMSTGCHLHFNVFRNGATMNGLPLVS